MEKIFALIIFISLIQVTYGQHVCVDNLNKSAENSGDLRLMLQESKMWKPGETITVSFLNGSQFLKNKVIQYAEVWENYANINFDFVQSGGKIRVAFEFNGDTSSWSKIGRDALSVSSSKPTMNFGWFDSSTSEADFRSTILHEFGHAIGCLHEHQHPNAGIPWNKPVVYNYFYARDWSKDDVDHNLFKKYSTGLTNFSSYDRNSIMHYPIHVSWVLDPNYAVGWNTNLSQKDKDFIQVAYPDFVTTDFSFESFSSDRGWNNRDHIRTLADVDGDEQADIVGFYDDAVYVAFSNCNGFNQAVKVIDKSFTKINGWNNRDHVRILADVNKDKQADIVGFYDDAVYVAFSNGNGFNKAIKVIDKSFTSVNNWNNRDHVRTLADVNGDKRADIVGFQRDAVYVAFSNGSGFNKPIKVIDESFTSVNNWNNRDHVRTLADVNGDEKADIIGFQRDAVYVAFSNRQSFRLPIKMIDKSFTTVNNWNNRDHVRLMADVNGDNKADVVGFHGSTMYTAVSNTNRFLSPAIFMRLSFTKINSWNNSDNVRIMGDVNGDNKADIVGFHNEKTYLYITK